MSDSDDLERRLAAVERAVDGNTDATGSDRESRAAFEARIDELEPRLDELESRIDELDAAVQAIRGFLGGVSAVDEAVERRADAAVAAVERLEARLDSDASVTAESPLDEGGDDITPPEDESSLRERLRGHW